MNRSPKKSPSRKGSASPSRRPALRKVSKSPVRRTLRDRSRSRGRNSSYFQEDLGANIVEPRTRVAPKSPRARKPLRSSPRITIPKLDIVLPPTQDSSLGYNELDFDMIAKQSSLLKRSPSIQREEVIRHSISRFDEVVSEAVINVRSSKYRVSQESDLKSEVEKEVKTLLTDNNVSFVGESPPREHGGCFGALIIMILLPVVIVSLQVLCSKDNCSTLDVKKFPTSLVSYLNMETLFGYVTFLFLQLCLGMLPLGKFEYSFGVSNGTRTYRCNGLVSSILVVACAIGFWINGWYSILWIVDQMVPIMCCSILVSFVASASLYFEAKYAKNKQKVLTDSNPFGTTGNFLYDFWVGRRINPHLGPVNVKLLFIRSSLLTAILINIAFILMEFEGKHGFSLYSAPLLLACTLQLTYLVDFLIFEKDYITSFTVQHEGVGFMLLLSSAVFPYFITLVPKFLFYNKINEISHYSLLGVLLLHLFGYFIFRLSNGQKASFRSDFNNSQFSSIHSLVCIDGKRLLVGGMWGRLRNPNHLGALLQYWSWSVLAALCCFDIGSIKGTDDKVDKIDWTNNLTAWLPLGYALLAGLLFAHRSVRDSRHCAFRYGSSWKRYTTLVRHRMLPKIF